MVIPSNISVQVGGIQNILCNATGNVTWTFNGGKLLHNAKSGFSGRNVKLHYIKVVQATTRNAGNYTCSVHSEHAIYEDTCILDVIGEG